MSDTDEHLFVLQRAPRVILVQQWVAEPQLQVRNRFLPQMVKRPSSAAIAYFNRFTVIKASLSTYRMSIRKWL